MRGGKAGAVPPLPSAPGASLVPCLMLRKGKVCVPGEEGPIAAVTADGTPPDPFDVIDRLGPAYPAVYVVDLDGIERGEPQLDYLQELSRDATVWVDAGVRSADQAIDIIVAGAAKVTLSSGAIAGLREVRRAWKLSSSLAFEVELGSSGARWRGEWPTSDPVAAVAAVREIGLTEVVVSPRGTEVPWPLVRSLSEHGPVWVDGSFELSDAPRLAENHATGGIFHPAELLRPDGASPSGRPLERDARAR